MEKDFDDMDGGSRSIKNGSFNANLRILFLNGSNISSGKKYISINEICALSEESRYETNYTMNTYSLNYCIHMQLDNQLQ